MYANPLLMQQSVLESAFGAIFGKPATTADSANQQPIEPFDDEARERAMAKWHDCMEMAAEGYDDGISDAASIAEAVAGVCKFEVQQMCTAGVPMRVLEAVPEGTRECIAKFASAKHALPTVLRLRKRVRGTSDTR